MEKCMTDEISTVKTPPVSEMETQVTMLDNAIDYLSGTIDTIIMKLNPVLMDIPSSTKEDEDPLECLSPLALSIRGKRMRIEELTNQLDLLKNRIAL